MEILGEGDDGPVTGIRVVKNRIENGRAVPTGEEEVIACGLVFRSIGYRGVPLGGIPFDDKRGLIRNEGGRVTGDGGEHECGEYVVGWVKRGPSGVIGTNKKDAADTVAKVLEDREAGRLNTPAERAGGGLVRRALPGARHLGGLARDRRARDRARRAAGPPAREARAHGRDARRRLRRPTLSRARRSATWHSSRSSPRLRSTPATSSIRRRR